MVARVAAAILFFAISVAAAAQPAARVYRIGFVTPLSATPEPPTLRALREGLRELGYIEGKNVVIEARFADGRNERLPELAAELVGLKPDVLVAGSDLGGKRLALLKEAIPGISHIALLQNSTSPISRPYVGETQSAARALNVKVDVFNAGNAADLDRALIAMGASGAQGLVVANDPFFLDNRVKLVQFAARPGHSGSSSRNRFCCKRITLSNNWAPAFAGTTDEQDS